MSYSATFARTKPHIGARHYEPTREAGMAALAKSWRSASTSGAINGHSAHSMASEFFAEDFLAGASSGMRTSADASVHAHGPSLTTTHASVIDLVLSIENVSVRSTLVAR